jgi:hypothetical protein
MSPTSIAAQFSDARFVRPRRASPGGDAPQQVHLLVRAAVPREQLQRRWHLRRLDARLSEAGATTDARPQDAAAGELVLALVQPAAVRGGFSAFRAYTGGQALDVLRSVATRITQTNANIAGLPANASITTGAQQYSNT